MRAPSPSSSIRKTLSRRSAVAEQTPSWTMVAVLRELQSLADPHVRAKMEYFGVRASNAQGISAPVLHALAKQIGKSHALALELWATGIHEARILATLIGEPEKVTAAGMRSEEHTSELQSQSNLVCRLLLEKKKALFASPHSHVLVLGLPS